MWPGASKKRVRESLPDPFCWGAQAWKCVVGEGLAQRGCDEAFSELVKDGHEEAVMVRGPRLKYVPLARRKCLKVC